MDTEQMTVEEKIAYAKKCGLIAEDGTSNVITLEDIAAEAYLKAEYNQILINFFMEDNA